MRVEEELKIDESVLKEHSSDARLIVNMRPKAMTSCRSNNDVAPRKTTKSPVLKGKDHRDSSVSGRYNYLRGVGNAVVQDEVRKSVDRIRNDKKP